VRLRRCTDLVDAVPLAAARADADHDSMIAAVAVLQRTADAPRGAQLVTTGLLKALTVSEQCAGCSERARRVRLAPD